MLPIIPIIAAAASASVLIHRKIKSKIKKDRHVKLIAYAREKNIHVDSEGNFNPNAQLPDGTPLLFDVMSNVELFTSLLDYGAAPNICDDSGVPAICHASAMEDPNKIVSSLLEHGANANAMDSEGKTAIFYAKSHEILKMLCDAGADINAMDSVGKTAIFYAKSRKILKMLCDAGADINARDSSGKTVLFYSLNNQLKVISLIKLGIDINAKDNEGKNVLFYISDPEQFYIIEFLDQNGLIINAADNNGNKFKINAADNNGNKFKDYNSYQIFKSHVALYIEPTLQDAVKKNNIIEVIRHLNEGTDPNIKYSDSKNRNTASFAEKNMVYLAVDCKNPEMIEVLAEAGADINNRGGSSPIEKAIYNEDIACLKKLLELGADPEPVRNVVKKSYNKEIKQIFRKYDKYYID